MVHLVTGGSGFLGNLIARRLHARGETVRILDIWDEPTRPKDIEYIECDILDREGVAKAMKGVDVVIITWPLSLLPNPAKSSGR